MKIMTKLIALICLLSLSSLASAQNIFFSPSVFYKTYNDTTQLTAGSGESETEVTDTYYDVKLGVILGTGLYVGAIYSQMDRAFGDTDQIRTSYGASIGYMQPVGWYIIGHYFLSSEYELSSSLTLTKGSGFQMDFGYLFELGSGFMLGPQVTYKTLSYDEYDTTGSSSNELEKGDSSELLPMIALAVKF